MINVYEQMQALLTENKEARERKNKGRAIRALLIKKYPALKDVPKDVMLKAIKSMESYDRAWRKVTQENKHLRGSDYYQKHDLEDAKKAELGYRTKPMI